MFRKSTTWAACALAFGLTLASCTGSSSGGTPNGTPNGSAKGAGPTLAVYNGGSGQFVKNFNPLSPNVLGNIDGMVYEPLFFFNNLSPLGSKPTPLLGASYSFNDKGTVLSVTTKSGVTWSDGQPFTANDVAFTFNLIKKTPELDTTGNAPTAKATDDTHVTLTFAKPSFTDGPNVLGTRYIVPEHIWKNKTNVATDPNDNPVGTGPMMLSDFNGQSYLLKKNPKFRDAADVKVPGVRVFSLSGNQAATDKLLAKQLDWAGIFIPNVDKVLKAAPSVSYSATGSQQIELNTCSNAKLGCTGPQTDKVVRHAIYQAIDRQQINKLAYFGKASPISPTYCLLDRDKQFIAAAYSGPAPMTPNVGKATQLLEGDGWTKGADGIYQKAGQQLSMTVLVTAGYTDYIATLQAMTEQLKAAGIEIKTQQVANNENTSAQALGHFQLAISGIFQGPAADPYYIYNNTFSTANTTKVGVSGNPYGNVSRFSSPVVDAALQQAAGTQDLGVKAAAYAKIQSVIVPDMPYIPVLNNVSFAEFNTADYKGWPTYDDQYASASPASAPGNGVVLTRLRPVS